MNKLHISSFKCRSANTNKEIISHLTEFIDIIFLQETLLNDNNHHILSECNSLFDYCHTPSIRSTDCFIGRGSGGLAILWKKARNFQIFPIYITERIMGIKLTYANLSYLLIYVYAYCDYGTSESYLNYKSFLSDLLYVCIGSTQF